MWKSGGLGHTKVKSLRCWQKPKLLCSLIFFSVVSKWLLFFTVQTLVGQVVNSAAPLQKIPSSFQYIVGKWCVGEALSLGNTIGGTRD